MQKSKSTEYPYYSAYFAHRDYCRQERKAVIEYRMYEQGDYYGISHGYSFSRNVLAVNIFLDYQGISSGKLQELLLETYGKDGFIATAALEAGNGGWAGFYGYSVFVNGPEQAQQVRDVLEVWLKDAIAEVQAKWDGIVAQREAAKIAQEQSDKKVSKAWKSLVA